MTDLTTTPNSTPAKRTLPAPSPELTALLDSAGSPDEAIRGLLAEPALVDEARGLLPALRHTAQAPAGQAGVKAVIGRRFALYPQPARSDGEWDAWWADYLDVLEDVPLASLEAAMRAHVADPASEFMPKPGRLRELAFTTPCRSLMRWQRAKRAIDIADAPKTLPPPSADPEAVRKMLAEYQAMAPKPAESRIFRPAPVDDGGLTAEMRALLAKQAEVRP